MTAFGKNLILASGSPRRRELLGALGMPFEVVTTGVDEIEALPAADPTPSGLARENARRKTEAVRHLRPGHWVLGADTVVALGNRLFGKPASLEAARDFLRALSGQTHQVITGCALAGPKNGMEIFHEISRVTFRQLSTEIIERYLAEVHVLDKAGAYALQERGEWLVERVEGSRANVIGLPVEALERLFRKHGWI
ncbi:MAG TPA: Maf family protein [Candidatus Methylacidiphilales bacterium]|nr:Maf family protein [Candidatus Methylacidiphilales bacterium]